MGMSEDKDPDAPEGPGPRHALSWWRKGLLVVLAVIGATLLAGLVWFALFVTHYWRPCPGARHRGRQSNGSLLEHLHGGGWPEARPSSPNTCALTDRNRHQMWEPRDARQACGPPHRTE